MTQQHRELQQLSAVAQARALELDEQRKDPEKYRPIPTHIPALNEIIGGIPVSSPFYFLLTAKEKLGKTTIAQNLADAWRAGTTDPIIYFQLEELAQQYVDRIFSLRTSLTKSDIRMLNITDEQMQEIYEAAQAMLQNETNIFLQDDVFVFDRVLEEMDKIHCTKAVIDNFQLLDTKGYMGANAQERFASLSRRIREVRNQQGKSFIIVSQQSDTGKAFGSSGPDRDADLRVRIEEVFKEEGKKQVLIPNLRKLVVLPSRIAPEGECLVGFNGAKNMITPIANVNVEDMTFENIVEQETVVKTEQREFIFL